MNGQTTPLLFIIRFPDEHGLTSPLSFLPFVPKGLSGTLSVYRPDARPSWQSADSIKTLQGKSEPRAMTVTRELSSTGFKPFFIHHRTLEPAFTASLQWSRWTDGSYMTDRQTDTRFGQTCLYLFSPME